MDIGVLRVRARHPGAAAYGQVVIDRDSATPLYEQVAALIEARITAGTYQPDRLIPSEAHFQQEFGVTRDTVRAGVAILRARGLVVTVRGKGTYVAAAPAPD